MPIATPALVSMEEPDDGRNNNDQLMTVGQATEFLGYRDTHVVLNLIKNGALEGHRIGKKWLIWKSKLIAFVNKN